jgi:hypothetical protein
MTQRQNKIALEARCNHCCYMAEIEGILAQQKHIQTFTWVCPRCGKVNSAYYAEVTNSEFVPCLKEGLDSEK